MSARNIVGGLAGAAVGAVKHPVETAGEAISKAKGVVSAGTAVAGTVAGRVRGGATEAKGKAAGTAKETVGKAQVSATETVEKAKETAKETVKDPAGTAKVTATKAKVTATETAVKAADVAKATTAKAASTAKATTAMAAGTAKDTAGTAKATAKKAAKRPGTKKAAAKKTAKREPQVVLAEPAPPVEPPIDVVGQALAAEAQDTTGAGRATEPRGASRDEEHGNAGLQSAETAEILAEIAEASELDLDVVTPAGTTGTEPLLDPSVAKAVRSEQETLHKASDPDKG